MDNYMIDYEQPGFIEKELKPIEGTYNGIARDGSVWDYRRGDWKKIGKYEYRKLPTVIVSFVGGGTALRSLPKLIRLYWGEEAWQEYLKTNGLDYDARKKGRNGRPVRCVETGKVYETMSAAAREYDVSRNAIYLAIKLNGRSNGVHWEYAD